MSTFELLIVAAVLALSLLWLAWIFQYGVVRGSLAAISRGLWLTPIFLAFFPENKTVPLLKSVNLQPLRILVDDSESMTAKSAHGEFARSAVEKSLAIVEAECLQSGCAPKISYLSAQDPDVAKGFSPLDRVLRSWLFRAGADPWLVISDGGDMQPAKSWSGALDGLGAPVAGQKAPRGMVIGTSGDPSENTWIEAVDVAPFWFESKPISSTIHLGRTGDLSREIRVQIQARVGDSAVATVNGEFPVGQGELAVGIVIPPMRRGHYLVTFHVLPNAEEKVLWDNEANANVEVMPNTVGILHLLGSPSWDGRFLRRYLKSEPKYDLISFFILRDPWDSNQVNERELSLIPFPVERLFNEELPNFRVIVLQNFTLLQFLLPEYQENLVKFVKNGGGLLFLGGERALQDVDLRNSPLREILPFDVVGGGSRLPIAANSNPFFPGSNDSPPDQSGPWYDGKRKFRIEMAEPELAKRNLANVYDDWDALARPLESMKWMQGLHHMENVQFRAQDFTPLLNARTEDGKTVPLAVASYPGNGRAIWVFSDSLWRVAQTRQKDVPRETYGQFMEAAVTWLLRQDMKKPLSISGIEFDSKLAGSSAWQAKVSGPAARFYQPSESWRLSMCGIPIEPDAIRAEKAGSDAWLLSGQAPSNVSTLDRCEIKIQGTNAAFGSVTASNTVAIPRIFADREIGETPNKLRRLADLTGADYAESNSDGERKIRNWIQTVTGVNDRVLPNKFRTEQDFYWVLTRWYFLVMLGFLPIEILARRWDKLIATGGKAYKRAWKKRSASA